MAKRKKARTGARKISPKKVERTLTPEQQVVWPQDFCKLLKVSAVTLWRWERAGKVPPRDAKVGPGGWRRSTIEAHLGLSPAARGAA